MGLLVALEMMTIHKRFITIHMFTFVGSLVCVYSPVFLEITFSSEDLSAIFFRTIECVAWNDIRGHASNFRIKIECHLCGFSYGR